MGYIFQNYGINWSIGYIKQKVRDVLGKIMGYTGKIMGYAIRYICQRIWDLFDKK